jgi:hypothetical protein
MIYPSEVENSNAIAAIEKYQPETVITAWMTLKTDDPEDILKDTASHIDAGHSYAPDEDEILNTGVTYIHIANESIHGDRLIMAKPHETYYFDWLISRGKHPEQNCIYVWNS